MLPEVKISRHLRTLAAAGFTAAALAGFAGSPAQAEPGTDTLYHAALRHFAAGNDEAGRAGLLTFVDNHPDDPAALSQQAIWAHYANDLPGYLHAMTRLRAVDARIAAGTDQVINAVRAAVATLPNPLPALVGPQTGIVVLGYGLLPDGSLRPELVNRLTAAWIQSIASPFSPIVVTGGNPRNGITEAEAMRNWLVGRGVPATRIHVENRAGSTVMNAVYSTHLLRDIGATSAVVVTSPNHIRRAVADFLVAGSHVVGATTSLEQLVSQLPPPDKAAQRGIYLDAIRTFQLTYGH
ncbi:hypothetical protein B0T36_09605 [Nocardia donostiensis]|nr:hypothetical protein B0T36_09605 [Nocardia donostiensis]